MRVLKGIYVLIIQVSSDVAVQVGALGRLTFKKGIYAYVGSAQNNLAKRVYRHLAKEKREFWHIDYLLNSGATRIATVFHKQAGKTEECKLAEFIGNRGEAVVGFGSSDCNCKSHLFQLESLSFLQELMSANALSSFSLSSSCRPEIRK